MSVMTIEQIVREFVEAWNKHDAKQLSGLWAPDGDLVDPFGRMARGREAIQALVADEHNGTLRDSTCALRQGPIRFLTPDVATYDWHLAITGIRRRDGRAASPQEVRMTVVLVKDRSGWRIGAARACASVPG